MLARMIAASVLRRGRRSRLAFAAVALGTSVAAGLLNVYLAIEDRMSEPLSVYGANILVRPAEDELSLEFDRPRPGYPLPGAYLQEADLARLKGETFWRNNILAFAPLLPVTVRANGMEATLVGTRGIRELKPYWEIRGSAPSLEAGVLVGAALAEGLGVEEGAVLSVRRGARRERLRVGAVFRSGGEEDRQLYAPLPLAQSLAGLEGKVKSVLVRALIAPPNALYEAHAKDPDALTPEERERYACTPFVENVAADLGDTLPGATARPILSVAAAQARLVRKAGLLTVAAALAAFLAGAAAALAASAAAVLERRREIALLKALGAGDAGVVLFLGGEALVLGLAAGGLGAAAGSAVSWLIGEAVFSRPIGPQAATVPCALALACAMSLLGAAGALGRALAIDPASALKGTP